MKLGIEVLIENKDLQKKLKGKRVALLGHPASVNHKLEHSVDLLTKIFKPGSELTALVGPQHGMKGDKQDNMIETDDELDPRYKIPVFSLYGKSRRLTPEMLETFDVILVDMLDVGCRIYTFLTTLVYVMQDCAKHNKSVWVLDRPNPAGRPVEGSILKPGWESFVGIGPILMRHGLTLGEAARWAMKEYKLDLDLHVVSMLNYQPTQSPGFGWPIEELSWVNPSPNIPTLNTVRCFTGTVLLEGTNLSEARGTTKPLQYIGAPGIDPYTVLNYLDKNYPTYLKGFTLRPCFFEPTFHKHAGKLCGGFEMHVDLPNYNHDEFKPYRLVSAFLKSVRSCYGDLLQWRQPPYEYEHERLAIDLLSGSDFLRKWVDDNMATGQDLEKYLTPDEKSWAHERQEFLLY